VDDRYRVVLDKEIREKLKAAPGDKVLAIPRTNSTVGAEIARLRHITLACKTLFMRLPAKRGDSMGQLIVSDPGRHHEAL